MKIALQTSLVLHVCREDFCIFFEPNTVRRVTSSVTASSCRPLTWFERKTSSGDQFALLSSHHLWGIERISVTPAAHRRGARALGGSSTWPNIFVCVVKDEPRSRTMSTT